MRDQRAKGYLINETVRLASGEWVVLLDADAVIPPDFLTRLDAAGHGADFVAPDGRKMLDRAATARILLGLCDPAFAWDELAAGPGEWRRRESGGAAVGYCQCVRRHCFEVVRYPEFRHFEGADYTFALEMERHFGPVRRLEGLPILHLDHGFSQWYGTQKHY
jgi:glycosyltransferase involved in cell wall biosynthesis